MCITLGILFNIFTLAAIDSKTTVNHSLLQHMQHYKVDTLYISIVVITKSNLGDECVAPHPSAMGLFRADCIAVDIQKQPFPDRLGAKFCMESVRYTQHFQATLTWDTFGRLHIPHSQQGLYRQVYH